MVACSFVRVLIAEDEEITRAKLEALIDKLGHDWTSAEDGSNAWDLVLAEPFDAIVSDWMMPKIDGVELCRRVKAMGERPFCHVLLVTSKGESADLVEGIMAGADDFIAKPVDADVLRARLHAAERMVNLERTLAKRIRQLEAARTEVQTLRGLLPVCMYCKNVRQGDDMWQDILAYLQSNVDAGFSHGICPDCYDARVKPMLAERKAEIAAEEAAETDNNSEDERN